PAAVHETLPPSVVVVVAEVDVVVLVVPPCVVVVPPDEVEVVVVPGDDVVVVAPGSRRATTSATNAPTWPSSASVSSMVGQSPFFSAFAKHPSVRSTPPSTFAVALSRHPFSFGSMPLVSAFWWHLRSPTACVEMHFFLPAEHLFTITSGKAGST